MSDPALELPLAFRLDRQPYVVMGLTWTECLFAVLVCGFSGFVTGFLISLLLGNWMFALPGFFVAGIGYFIAIGTFMRRYKHNRPNGYYQQKIYAVLQRLRLGNWYIDQSGYRDPRKPNRVQP